MDERKVKYPIAAVLTIIMFVCTFFAFFGLPATATAVTSSKSVSNRVTMNDLMGRYPIDWVVGPIDVQDVSGPDGVPDGKITRDDLDKDTGKYTYIQDDAHKDVDGNYTNNIYGIPANKYFDVENYIYTESDTKTYTNSLGNTVNGRILYGWKPDIRSVRSTIIDGKLDKTNTLLAENGEMPDANGKYYNTNPSTGIYVTYSGTKDALGNVTYSGAGTTEKYALIVPSDITTVGNGSGAFVANKKAYYAGPYIKNNNSWYNKYYSVDYTLYDAKFTDFGCFIMGGMESDANALYWQPQERLTGVYFPEDSRLQEIMGAPDSSREHITGHSGANRTTVEDKGKGAFEGSDNLRFLILPGQYEFTVGTVNHKTTGLKTIGANAFFNCTHLVDTNIPESVTSLGDYAFANCSGLLSISVPKGLAVPSKTFDGCSKLLKSGEEMYIFAGAPENGKLDTGRNGYLFLKKTVAGVDKWIAKGFSGETGEDPSKVFIFPDGADFSNDSDRRLGVQYDYIGSNGEKIKGEFTSGSVNSYEIAENFAANTWCQNVVLPKEVTTIGERAFYNSHVSYLEMYATKIGEKAFYDSGTATSTQWYYLHGGKSPSEYNVAADAFGIPDTINKTRYIVYENKAMYDKFGGKAPTWLEFGTTDVRYQIPFVANVYNEDRVTKGYDVSLLGGDMSEHFFNDSDYNADPVLNEGSNAITFTKRLSGLSSTFTKQKTGGWSNSGDSETNTQIKLSNMDSTVWFTLAQNNLSNVDDSAVYKTVVNNVSSLYNDLTSTVVNVYTKNISKPILKTDREHDFGGEVIGENDVLTFGAALLENNREDYSVSLKSFNYPAGETGYPTLVQNAGTYILRVDLNSKWGVWKESYASTVRQGNVVVNRQLIELGDFENLPVFTTGSGKNKVELGGTDIGTTLYEYADGWYMYPQEGTGFGTVDVVNSFTYFTNSSIDLSYKWMNGVELYTVGQGSGIHEATNSGKYDAYYMLQVKFIPGTGSQTNYQFTDNNVSANSQEFVRRGMVLSGVQPTSASLRKSWYVVMQSNWFIDSEAEFDKDNPFDTPPFVLATIGGESVRTWEYETAVDLHWPRLAYNDTNNVQPAISIEYDGKKFDIATLDNLKYYINSAMPAGKYTVTIEAGKVDYINEDGSTGTYPAVKDVIYIEVTPKAFEIDGLKAAIAAGQYEFPYRDGKFYVCTDLPAVASELEKLNNTLNKELQKYKSTNSYWATEEAKGYYSNEAAMSYNLDRWGNDDYISDGNLPINADEYTVYYCVSAKNYQSYGGAGDADRREKIYKLLIYNQISVMEQLLQMKDGKASYLLDMTYTGEDVYTSIPYSQYFKYDFNDTDYKNVHRVSVTLTLNNPRLAKWFIDEELKNLFVNEGSDESWYSRFDEIDENNPGVLTAYFEILSADNSWVVTPSMPGWSYDGFDSAVHAVSAKLKFEETTAYFGINTKADGAGEWLAFGNGNNYFTVSGDGQIEDTAVINVLKSLSNGTYYLFGFAAAYDENIYGKSNVNAYNLDETTGIPIIVTKANNRWVTSPDIIRWYWSEYDKETNIISGTPYYGNEVTYTILDENKKVIEGLIGITVDAEGVIVDSTGTIENILKGLGAGTYYLLATVEGTDCYTGINEYILPDNYDLSEVSGLTFVRFVISQFNNYWEISPSMTGWQYSAYNEGTNFVAGTPKFAGEEIIYKLYKDIGEKNIEDNEYLGELSELNLQELEVGKYLFYATMEGTNDFKGLSAYSGFEITINRNNKWEIIPSVEGWIYGEHDNESGSDINLTVGIATYGKVVAYTLSKYNDETKEFEIIGSFLVIDGKLQESGNGRLSVRANSEEDELEKSVRQKIYGLAQTGGAGNYKLTVVSKQTEGEPDESTDNYIPTEIELLFTVGKADNEWAENKAPSIESWTWDEKPSEADSGETKYAWDEYENGSAGIQEIYYKTNSAGELLERLNGKPSDVGLYAYVVTAFETKNYKELALTVYFEIKQFENDWKESEDGTKLAPESTLSWTFGDDVQGDWDNIAAKQGYVTFIITGTKVNGGAVVYSSEEIDEKGGISAVLKALDAGTYSVISFVTCPLNDEGNKNYSDLTATTSLSVRQASNNWGDVEPFDKEAERGKFEADQFPTIKPAYGEVRYELRDGDKVTDIEEKYSDILSWAKQQKAGTYTVYAVVYGENNYTGLEKTFTVTVLPSTSNWDIDPSDYDWVYGHQAVIEVPAMDEDKPGTVTYEFKYEGEATVAQPDSLSAEALRQYFNSARRAAGVYTITAYYTYEDEQFDGSVIITIEKAAINWVEGATPPVSVSFSYGNSNLLSYDAGNDLDGNKHGISYSVISGGNVTAVNGDIKEYLDLLDAGTYTLIVSAKANDAINYKELSAHIEIHINKASNGWVAGTEPSASLNWVRGEIGDFILPKAQHGNVTVKITGGDITQTPSIDDLIDVLNGLDAGYYTVTFTVTGDDVNYDGFEDKMQFVMSLQVNDWLANTTPEENMNLPWSANGINLKIPQAQKGTVKFEVELLTADTNISLPPVGCSEAVLRTWLKNIQSSTYCIKYYVDATRDYAGLSGQTFITVAKIDNKWTAAPISGSVVEWSYGETASPEEKGLDFRAVYGTSENNNLLRYYVNDVYVNSLEDALNALSVGEYTLRAEIPESQNYKALSSTVTLKVVKGDNGWENDNLFIGSWQWDTTVASSEVNMILPKPLHENVVNIRVSLDGTEKISFTLNYYPQADGNTTDNAAALRELLRTLDAGNYTIIAEIPESANWGASGAEVLTCDFTVSQNENEYYSDPYVNDWVYGADRQYPQVVDGLKYKNISDIVYEYFYVADADGKPVTKTRVTELNTAGIYEFTATVAGTVNYPDLVYTGSFKIFRATPQWQMLPNITGWTWNEFNEQNNLFVGAVDSGAEVTFRIIDQDNKVVIQALKADNSGVVTDEKILAILRDNDIMLAGAYTFVATAGVTVNYNAIEVTGSFNISVAENRWEEYPKIKEWAENNFTNENLPSAKSKYGNITLKITSIPQDGVKTITYFEAEYNSQGELIGDIKVRSFYDMKQGYYKFSGTVQGDERKYGGLTYEDQIEVFISSSLRPKNGWEEVPKIDSWTAGEDGPTTDTARALRATAYLRTYYYVTDNGLVEVPEYELKAGKNVDALGRVIYYPTVPGQYELHLKAIYEETSGIVEFDTLQEILPFTIYKRIIEWTETPNIVDWEYGSEPSTPVASFNFIDEADSTLSIWYRQIKTTDGAPVNGELLKERPVKAGGYEMVVVATAKYCDPVEARVEFNVVLAKNSWIDIPGIEEWTEEFEPNDPIGRAEHGEVKYVYKRKSDGAIFTELPTEEGEYTLCATVEAEGYERLYNEVDFSVGPAFDTTFLIIDIVLASVLCALTVVVIIFAFRRYKENG